MRCHPACNVVKRPCLSPIAWAASTAASSKPQPSAGLSRIDHGWLCPGQDHQPKVGDQWNLKGRSAAGSPFPGALKSGEAIRILTGAPLPPGADWVLPQELVEASPEAITLARDASSSPWIRAADEECRSGDSLLPDGIRLRAADLGRLAGCGVATLKVRPKPRIGLLVSGDELIPPGEPRQKERSGSNSTLLEAMLQQLATHPAQARRARSTGGLAASLARPLDSLRCSGDHGGRLRRRQRLDPPAGG